MTKSEEARQNLEFEVRLLRETLDRLGARTGDLEERLEQATRELERLLRDNRRLESSSEALQSALDAVYASNSWRISRPLRSISRLAQSVLLRPAGIERPRMAEPGNGGPSADGGGAVLKPAGGKDPRIVASRTDDSDLSPREKEVYRELIRMKSGNKAESE